MFSTFQSILPTLIHKFSEFLDSLRTSNRGKKRTVDLELFFKAFYSNVRDATSTSNFKYYFGLPKSTYFHYLKLLSQSNIFKSLLVNKMSSYQFSDTLLVDTCTIKSHNGLEGTGKSNTDRGRNGIKVQIISDLNGLIYSLETNSANTHDSKIFRESQTLTPFQNKKDILMDSAYVGKPIQEMANSYNLDPIVVPKRTARGTKTHTLSQEQTIKLKKRWLVEQHISVLRHFKAISNKYVKQMKTFHTYLDFAKLLINTYHIGRS
jgi:hypothetical protein